VAGEVGVRGGAGLSGAGLGVGAEVGGGAGGRVGGAVSVKVLCYKCTSNITAAGLSFPRSCHRL